VAQPQRLGGDPSVVAPLDLLLIKRLNTRNNVGGAHNL